MFLRRNFSRRKFLRVSAVTATAGAVLPNVFLNETRAASGENPADFIRVGFIGVGNQGSNNLKKLMKNAVAVCDVDRDRLAQAAKLVGTETGRRCAAYSDFRQLLASKDIDAVVVTTPDHWHALPTVYACEAGKDVYCEKPLSLTIAEGQAMIKAARRYNRVVQTGSQQRSDPNFLKACEYVRNGRLGKVRRVLVGLSGVNWTKDAPEADCAPPAELDYEMWLGPAPLRPYNRHRVHYYFRFFWDYSGGQMTNWGAHHLDIAQWALGKDESGPVEVTGSGEFDPGKRFEVPTQFQITYRYANGVMVECRSPGIQVNDILSDKRQNALNVLDGKGSFTGCIFDCERGLLYVNRGVARAEPAELFADPIRDTEQRLYASRNHYQNWLDCIKSRKLPVCDVATGHRSATVCHLGNMAVRLGRKLKWDPRLQQVEGDAEANKCLAKAYRQPWTLPS